jgi:hypothetical protein
MIIFGRGDRQTVCILCLYVHLQELAFVFLTC